MASIRDQSSGRMDGEGVVRFFTPGWRQRLREASFKSVPFHVEQQGRQSGRRTVLHEYPKLDRPYAEDLGRHAIRYQMTGYICQKLHVQNPQGGFRYRGRILNPVPGRTGSNFASIEYDVCRDELIQALESFGPGPLIDPYNNRLMPMMFQCERYSVAESRERGGVATFEMSFIEAGSPALQLQTIDSTMQTQIAADQSIAAAQQQLNNQQAGRLGEADPSRGGVPGFSPA